LTRSHCLRNPRWQNEKPPHLQRGALEGFRTPGSRPPPRGNGPGQNSAWSQIPGVVVEALQRTASRNGSFAGLLSREKPGRATLTVLFRTGRGRECLDGRKAGGRRGGSTKSFRSRSSAQKKPRRTGALLGAHRANNVVQVTHRHRVEEAPAAKPAPHKRGRLRSFLGQLSAGTNKSWATAWLFDVQGLDVVSCAARFCVGGAARTLRALRIVEGQVLQVNLGGPGGVMWVVPPGRPPGPSPADTWETAGAAAKSCSSTSSSGVFWARITTYAGPGGPPDAEHDGSGVEDGSDHGGRRALGGNSRPFSAPSCSFEGTMAKKIETSIV